jgi:hypothetical protein
MRRVATFLIAIAVLAGPAAALAQDNPLGPLPPGPSSPTPTVVAPSSPNNNDDGGLETWQELMIFGAGVVLLGGIGFAIVSDARHRAPVKDAELAHPGAGPIKRNRSQKQRERARAKAKTGRAQRKRNRSRGR